MRWAFLICAGVMFSGWAISRPSNTPSPIFVNLKIQPSSWAAVCVSKSTFHRRCQFRF
nr:MAG TPA: Sporulation protein YhaL [Caudoviricetes sp.]